MFLLKVAVARPRPAVDTLVGSPWWDYSFPSGHTADGTVTWVLATVLLTAGLRAWVRRAAVVGVVTVAAGIGCSRVYLGYHWTSDVLAGWLLAGAVLCLTLAVGRLELRSAAQNIDEPGQLTAGGGRADQAGGATAATRPVEHDGPVVSGSDQRGTRTV